MNQFPSIWGGGQLLAFSGLDGETDFNNALCLQTSFDGFAFALKNDTFNDAFLRYTGKMPDKVELTGDFFRFYSGDKISSGAFADSCNLLLTGEFEFDPTPEYEYISDGNKLLIAAKGFLKSDFLHADQENIIRERSKFLQQIKICPELSEAAQKTVAKALSQLKTQIYSPERQISHYWSTPDRWPHKQMWLWDSVFHAIGVRHIDPALARDLISAMFDIQQPDGMIPHSGNPSGFHPCTQPPVLTVGMKLIDQISPCPEWITGLAPKLAKYLEWIMANRDSDGAGLVEWQVGKNANCRGNESGMDNSSRFDGAIQLDAVDFNAFLAHECETMAEFQPERKDYWLGHHQRLCRLINERLWNEELGIYVDYDVAGGKQCDIAASAGFMPLLCGAATPEQAERLVGHLKNPETFGSALRIPSVAKNNRGYRKDMWCGPVWVNINYLIILGLERYGYYDLAREICQETMQEIEKWYLARGTLFEFYDDDKITEPANLDRKGKRAANPLSPYHLVMHDYGWTATLYLEMLYRRFL
ncbi:MAG: flagellar biosynthesis protein FlgM [Lentisphaeria bacterium]|nr:flagellar biosynthesis protein FlgM [Lentisphaeria bacterium]